MITLDTYLVISEPTVTARVLVGHRRRVHLLICTLIPFLTISSSLPFSYYLYCSV
jgi:hypothetical protein